jgi:hypothetical protein
MKSGYTEPSDVAVLLLLVLLCSCTAVLPALPGYASPAAPAAPAALVLLAAPAGHSVRLLCCLLVVVAVLVAVRLQCVVWRLCCYCVLYIAAPLRSCFGLCRYYRLNSVM